MDFTAQQWQWFLQQSQHQKQRPQTIHWRQSYAGAADGGGNWWADEAAQAWAAAAGAALRPPASMAGGRQTEQQGSFRNVPWFRKPAEAAQLAKAETEDINPEGGLPRSGEPGLGPPPSDAAEQSSKAPLELKPPNPLSHLPLAIQRLAAAATHQASPPHTSRLPPPPSAPPSLPQAGSSLPSTPSPVAKAGCRSQHTTSTSPCYYDRRCTRINCWHQHPNGRNIDDKKLRSRTPRRSRSKSTHRKSTTVHSGYTTPQRRKPGSESPAPTAPTLPAPPPHFRLPRRPPQARPPHHPKQTAKMKTNRSSP